MRRLRCINQAYFNPRTHEECDVEVGCFISTKKIFQSTHSRGVRLGAVFEHNDFKKFQSTHSRGVRRRNGTAYNASDIISIHALTRSATIPKVVPVSNIIISIHALTRSATDPIEGEPNGATISIHALTRSATDYKQALRIARTISIHALTRSATIA